MTTPLEVYPSIKPLFRRLEEQHLRLVNFINTQKPSVHGLSPQELFVSGILNRTLQLNQAFDYLIQHWNYSTAGAILRLHLDSLLKVAYISQTDDAEEIIREVMKGTDFRKIKDADGRPLTDANLLAYAERYIPTVKSIYKEASSLVHFSEKFIFMEDHPESWPQSSIQEMLKTYSEITTILIFLIENWLNSANNHFDFT